MQLILAFVLFLGFYPYAISAPSEVERGGVYNVTVSAPALASVNLVQPTGIVATLIDRQGETIHYTLTVADDAPMSRVPVELGLVVDGVLRTSAPIRIWTEAPRQFPVWLPLIHSGG